jgi:hypothetical protein
MTDEVLDALIPAGTWNQLPSVISDWFGGLVDAVLIQPSDDFSDEFAELIQRVKLTEARLTTG